MPSRTPQALSMVFGLMIIAACSDGCRRSDSPHPASIEITHVPAADPGGPEKMDFIEGRVTGAAPGQQIVLYAHSGVWWVQPFNNQALTKIQSGSTWKNTTHLGTEYAAMLVGAGYDPPARLQNLPPVGGSVFAVAVNQGKPGPAIVNKTIHFSGYDWNVRSAGSDRGGATHSYGPENAWTDAKGFLHLRMEQRKGEWYCAEINLNRSLGYGTYRFVVEDVSHVAPAAVLGMFTFDENSVEESRNELDVELSQWGDPDRENTQYVVQPFYVPANVYRFNAPPGTLTHSFRWEPGRAEFKTARGEAGTAVNGKVFTTGIPKSMSQTVHIDLYDFHYSKNAVHQPAEVVIEKFEYLP
jgi:hypothetical protein